MSIWDYEEEIYLLVSIAANPSATDDANTLESSRVPSGCGLECHQVLRPKRADTVRPRKDSRVTVHARVVAFGRKRREARVWSAANRSPPGTGTRRN